MKLSFEHIFAFDTETGLIGKGQVAPKLVCMTYTSTLIGDQPDLVTSAEEEAEQLLAIFEAHAANDKVAFVGQNVAYDMAVMLCEFPHLAPLIFQLYYDGRVFDTKINEKLLILSTTGFLEGQDLSLAGLNASYLGGNRFEQKEDPDSWRLRYIELLGVPSWEYPSGASSYALEDATDTRDVFRLQVEKATESGHGSMNTASFQAAVDFCLFLATAHGIHTDLDRVELFSQALNKVLNDENLEILYASGVLRRRVLPRIRNPRQVERGEAEPIYTKGKEPTINKKELQELVERTSVDHGLDIVKTDPSKTFPDGQTSTADEVLQELKGFDPVLDKYMERQEVIKLQTTYLPNLREGIVYPNYDVLKSTGRTSSYKGSKKKQLFPSTNIQNQPRIEGVLSVRENYVARPGHVFLASDYDSLELCSFAQVVYWKFGYSTLRDQINNGYSPHEFLGAQLCLNFDSPFRTSYCGGKTDPEFTYEAFLALKKVDKDKFKFYRKLAKPTGLGYPGGLGPVTFRAFAKATYGVTVSLEEAKYLRDLWFNVYPEHREYLRSINHLEDPQNIGYYAYQSPMGMYRAGATYCAAANGLGLQTPSAEGAKAAVWDVQRACHDWTREDVLFSCRMAAFIHDEIIVEAPDDDLAQPRAESLSEIMKKDMQRILPDVTIGASPVMMRRWYKGAEPAYDDAGRLIPWEPNL